MHCIDPLKASARRSPVWRAVSRTALLGLLASCAAPERTPSPAPGAAPGASPVTETVLRPAPRAASPGVAPARGLPAPATPKSIAQLRYQAAQRLIAANPDITYTGEVPQPLLAIPVLEIELNADGSVRRIEVMRHPSQARDTTQLAIDAVHRAAPFGDVSRLPRPWKFPETFLFRDDRRFKPRTLDS